MFRTSQVHSPARRRASVIALTVIAGWSIATAGAVAIANSTTLAEEAAAPTSTTSSSTTSSTSSTTSTTTSTTAPESSTTVPVDTEAPATETPPAEPAQPEAPTEPVVETDEPGRAGVAIEVIGTTDLSGKQTAANLIPQETEVAAAQIQLPPTPAAPIAEPGASNAQDASIAATTVPARSLRSESAASPTSVTPMVAMTAAPTTTTTTTAAPALAQVVSAPTEIELATPTSSVGNSSPAITWFVAISLSTVIALIFGALMLFLRSGAIGTASASEISLAGLRTAAGDARLAELQIRRYAGRRLRTLGSEINRRLRH